MWNLEAQELPEQIVGLLRDTGVPPANLELEITESSIMGDPQRVITTLDDLAPSACGSPSMTSVRGIHRSAT